MYKQMQSKIFYVFVVLLLTINNNLFSAPPPTALLVKDGRTFTQSITPGNTTQLIGHFRFSPMLVNANFIAINIKLEGTRSGVSNFKLWASTSNIDFDPGSFTQLGSTIAADPGDGNQITFSGFSYAVNNDTYYYLTADIAADASGLIRGFIVNTSDISVTNNTPVYFYNISIAPLSSAAIALPVELTSFTANVIENKVTLNWQTATEVNNYGFEVERSVISNEVRNLSWEKVGFVEGHGNSISPKEYSFVDNKTSEVFENLGGLDAVLKYRLKQIDFDGNFEYSEIITVGTENFLSMPMEYALEQNYPNPFNPTTTIKYSIPSVIASGAKQSLGVTLKVYDMLGNEVATLVNEQKSAGKYKVNFDARNLASGIYFYKINTSGGFTSTKKLILMK